LLKNADIALYAAKAIGRATIMMFEPQMRDELRSRRAMVRDAIAAIHDDRILPFYQPKIDLGGHAVVGLEALLRWRLPDGRIGLPADLEAAFEDLEVAAAISGRMIERVIADIRRWLDRGTNFHHVAINASAAEFRRDDFAESLLEQLRRAEVPTECLQLEVTETVFLGCGVGLVGSVRAYALGKGIPVVSLKLEWKDPPGFIGHVQAQKGSINDPAASASALYKLIAERLGAVDRLHDGLVSAFVRSADFNDARYRFDRMAANVEKLTPEQLESIIKGYRDNANLHNAFYLDNQHERLVKYLKRATGAEYRIEGADIRAPAAMDLDDDIPF
jgi:hypothetical protein